MVWLHSTVHISFWFVEMLDGWVLVDGRDDGHALRGHVTGALRDQDSKGCERRETLKIRNGILNWKHLSATLLYFLHSLRTIIQKNQTAKDE